LTSNPELQLLLILTSSKRNLNKKQTQFQDIDIVDKFSFSDLPKQKIFFHILKSRTCKMQELFGEIGCQGCLELKLTEKKSPRWNPY